MIEPIDSLAFSVATYKNVYALLLGSGISRNAGILTGWEITLDLIERLADTMGESEECKLNSPEKWYVNKFQKEPNYSDLLEDLARTPAERTQLLRSYFEPTEETEEEQEQGIKQPTRAHHAIAQLVKNGFIRMILTTNFDRLMEQVLTEVGVNPSVISSKDNFKGALPYIHSPCTLVKLHGDYLDTRIRNTEKELSEYDAELDEYLDRILDEFGLVVCGWSAEWDIALRNAMERCPNRRFQTFWTVRGNVTEYGMDLIRRRAAVEVPIQGADEFFSSLEEKVTSITEYRKPHPVNLQTAVATLKRYLSEDKYQIKLYDFINEEVERVLEATATMETPLNNKESITKQIRKYEEITKVLQHLFAVGCYWGDVKHIPIWTKALKKLADYQLTEGNNRDLSIQLRRYPALLLMYAGGMASIAAEKYKTTLAFLYLDGIVYRSVADKLTAFVNPIKVLYKYKPYIEGKETSTTPVSDLLFELLLEPLKSFAPHKHSIANIDNLYEPYESEYHFVFDRFEFLLGITIITEASEPWAPIGQYIWKSGYQLEEFRVFNAVDREIRKMGKNWPPLRNGLFNGSLEKFRILFKLFKESCSRVS